MSVTQRRYRLEDERGLSVREIAGLDVDIPRARNWIARLAFATGIAEAFGPSGFAIRLYGSSGVCIGTVIVSQAEHDGAEWIHASIAWQNHLPVYKDLAILKDGVFGPARFAFQVFPSADRHVNIHARALHLWGLADGSNPLPDFGAEGTI